MKKYSPHAWGWTINKLGEYRDKWVFPTRVGMDREGIESVIDSVAKRAGIPPPSPHDFRRAFALNMLRQGCDIFVLQRLMGHSDLTVICSRMPFTGIQSPVERFIA